MLEPIRPQDHFGVSTGIRSAMDTTTLLSILRDRNAKLWVEGGRLKCSAPAGALDPELRTALTNRKEDVLAFLRQAETTKNGPADSVLFKHEEVTTPLLQTIS